MEPVERAHELAATLARRGVDPNEVAGVFRHLRAFLDQAGIDDRTPDQGVEYWWRWLETIAGPGLAAIQRSNQTEGYYREIYAACERTLRELTPVELAQTLGWAVRLTRYYLLVGTSGARAVGSVRSISAPASTPPVPVDPEQKLVDDLLRQLRELPDQRVATEIDRFVVAWRRLATNDARRCQLALAIVDKVQQAGRKKASVGKKWYQELIISAQEA